ncbi:uncharacterized protein LOC130733094 [Lotus japonicus]|uniref:uncharacterized protein LOC130733094 n=1 Tax=Lotus japonicus TaxID=34305 RepID=UPI00258F1E10|nr:uncharacterized protein LOC130733094 [Lotus japonicus]
MVQKNTIKVCFWSWLSFYLHHRIQIFKSISTKMIQLLFPLLAIEFAFILLLSFANPLRKLVVKGLDILKQGRGPVVINTVAATMFLVLGSTIYSIIQINKRTKDAGMINPTEEVLMAHHLLEASLMGFSLFLGLVMDRQHYYIREITLLRKSLEIAKKQTHSREPPKIREEEETEKKKDKQEETMNCLKA